MMLQVKPGKKIVEEKVAVYRTQSYWDLFEAIGVGSEEKVVEVLENAQEDPRKLVMKKDLQGLTPLKKAVALSRAEIARILVSFGAEPSARDPLQRTALHVAAMQGKRELIAPLLVSSDSSVNVQDHDGWTPLHLAVRGHHEKAISWLLYAGADINLKNKNDMTSLDMCDSDSPIRQMIEKQAYNLDDCPVELCSAFIGAKRLNMIGSGGSLMFVTSGLWSQDMEFFFNVRIRPYLARPPIPLRQDEMFFGDVCRYRMMYHLPNGQSRVHAYFLSFEYFRPSEIILKITSKSKFLGEVPVALSTYTQDNFTCFLASAEMDLKDAGQFVLVKRPTPVLLTKFADGVYSNNQYIMFKFNLPPGALPGPPPNWDATRESRAREETEAILRDLQPEGSVQENGDENTNADNEPNLAEVNSANEDAEGAGTEQDEENVRHRLILDGNEPDDCEDFYYISKGWGLYLDFRDTLPLFNLLDKSSQERNIVVCNTGFYIISHSSGQHPKQKSRVQIPKTDDFVKIGTVLVLMRDELQPGETEFPDPDDQADEYFLSEDGKNIWGTFWLNKERERWSLISSGIVNKRTRVIFETTKLSTFIVIQLKIGSQKWEAESDEDVSSDEEEEKMKLSEDAERVEGEGELDEEGGPRASSGLIVAAKKESFREPDSRKRSNAPSAVILFDYGDDDVSDEEDSVPTDNENLLNVEHAGKKASFITPDHNEARMSTFGKQRRETAPHSTTSGEPGKQNDNTSNVYGENNSNNNQPDGKHTGNTNNRNTSNNKDQYDDESNDENLTAEERTVVKNLEPATSTYALVLGVPYKPLVTVQVPPEQTGDEKVVEDVAEEDDGQTEADKESDEDIPVLRERSLSIASVVAGKTVLQSFKFGPALADMNFHEQDEYFFKNAIALMWRYRNHKQASVVVFSRPRDTGFDLVIEIVCTVDLYVRAEHWWSQDYRMVAESETFPLKSGRLFSFAMDGTMLVEQPVGSSPGYILTRTHYCYLSQINSLHYFVKRGISSKEDEKGQKKGPKKKDDMKSEPAEPDAILEITGYPRGTRTNGIDVALIPIFLTGHDLWYDRHVQLRQSDNIILSRLVKYLRRDVDIVKRWWKVLIMLGYPEKMVEEEKGKNKVSMIVGTFLKRWFEDNLNSRDRGILTLITILNTLDLESTLTNVVTILKAYKAELITIKQRPRYLLLLFHWIVQTKITRNNLIRMIGPQIMKPVSDIFLLRLSELTNADQMYKIGACMDVEDNVLHAIAAEEIITEPQYLIFRVFIKSRQKKDEIIHYTLLLLNMAKQCEQHEAKIFIVNETRKWMETVADTDHEICAKLHNVFD